MKNVYMAKAIQEAQRGVRLNHGGPFGAVIVRNRALVAAAHNQVLRDHDPTAHAEVLAVRRAAKKLQHFDLSDCEIYTTCEPCPMCLAALYWARIDKIYYGCTRLDAAEIGFDDNLIYRILAGRSKRERIETETLEREACLQVFKRWLEKSDRQLY